MGGLSLGIASARSCPALPGHHSRAEYPCLPRPAIGPSGWTCNRPSGDPILGASSVVYERLANRTLVDLLRHDERIRTRLSSGSLLATPRLPPDPRKLLLEIGQPLAGVESQLGQGSHSARFGKRMNARHVRMGLMAMVGLFMVCGASYHIGYGVGRTAGRTAGVQAERACWIMAPSSPHGPFVAHRDVRHPLLTARVDRRPHGKLNIIDAPFPARSEDPRRPNQPAEATETRGSVSTMKTGDRPGR